MARSTPSGPLHSVVEMLHSAVIRLVLLLLEGFIVIGLGATPEARSQAREVVLELRVNWLKSECLRRAQRHVSHNTSGPDFQDK